MHERYDRPGFPMRHGIQAYFLEYAAFERRLATLIIVCSLGSLLFLIGIGREVTHTVLDHPHRFGFEGPDQWVERIRLEQLANEESAGLYDVSSITQQAKKGGKERLARHDPNATPDPRPIRPGEGPDAEDLATRAKVLHLDAPVVRSEDLVIERLVRPDYPEEARDKSIEGLVEMLALVDTSGDVVEVHIVGGTRDPLLERAASQAVLQCHYRPYRVNDVTSRVWAAFRIAFTLY